MTQIKGFIKSEQVWRVLNAGKLSGQNVVLFGPGGYGKSEMALEFLKQSSARYDQIMVKALSVGSTVDDLLGGPNIKELKDTGNLVYNCDNSIFSVPFLILEEAFDAPTRVLEAMKDILTSGFIRNGKQQYKIKTKFIIVCTNRPKAEIIEDDSSRALMERFPLSYRVHWNTHTLLDYQDLIKCIFGKQRDDFDALMDYMLTSIKEDDSKDPPPPRTAVRMFQIMEAAGVESLEFVDGLPNINRALNGYKATIQEVQKKNKLIVKIAELETRKKVLTEDTPLKDIREYNEDIDTLIKWAGDSLTKEFDMEGLRYDI